MSNQKKKKKKEEKKNPLDDVPAHLRDFIESIALKEQPESPGAMRKKAQLKRKEALENTEEATNIKQMMSGVSQHQHSAWLSLKCLHCPELSVHRPGDHDSLEQLSD